MQAKPLLLLFCLTLSASEQHFWDKQDPSTWTAQQISHLTTASPWAKQVTAVLISNESNMAAATVPRSGGRGRSSQETSNVPSPTALPKLPAIVQWLSAKPMQEVLKLHLPSTFDGHYILCVNGLPLNGNTSEVGEETTLQIKRGDPIHPEVTYQDPADTSAIYFGFLPSTLDIATAKTAIFTMVSAPYSVKTRFSIAEMKYHGEPSY